MKKLFTLLFTFLPTNIILAQGQVAIPPLEITIKAKILLLFVFIIFLSSFFLIYHLHKLLRNYANKPLIMPFFYIVFFVWLNFIIMSTMCIFIFIFLPQPQNIISDQLSLTTIAVLTLIASFIAAPMINRRFFSIFNK